MDKPKIKKIVGAIIIALIVILAITVALGSMNGSRKNSGGYNYSGGANMPMSAGLPGGSEEMMALPSRSNAVNDSATFSKEAGLTEQTVSDTGQLGAVDKKIIKNGNLTMKVANADNAANDVASIAKINGGEVFTSNFYENTSNVKSGTITVKVPVANFEKAFSELKKVASLVVRESTSGQDVTEQFVDLESRLKNKQEEEKAFADILTRSGQIDDVLKVTRELARVRGEIEVIQGQLKFMASQTDMSVISVNLSEDDSITISDSWRPLQIAKDAVNDLISKVQKFISFVIVLIVTVIPILALYLFLFFILYWIGKKIYHKFIKRKNAQDISQNNNLNQ
jgi:hypothetical protein